MDVARDVSVLSSPTLGPVLGAERIHAMDVLRGVAVLGILLMNITGFALPFAASFDPTVGGGHTGANLWVWATNTVLFEGKMRAIFSMLFGAGMLVLTSRLEQRGLGTESADVYYRRLLWLLAFGLVHAYFIWWGDILFFYSVLGLFLFPLRRLSSRTLIAAGLVLLLVGAGRGLLGALDSRATQAAAAAADAAAARGDTLNDEQKEAQAAWTRQVQENRPGSEALSAEIAAYQGGYGDALQQRAGFLAGAQAQWLYHYFVFDIGGMMLLGIGLLKANVLTTRLPYRTYAIIVLLGYGLGLPLAALATSHDITSGFNPTTMAFGSVMHAIARVPIAMAHIAVVMLVCKTGILRWLTSPLAAVGQTAFSCYIIESLICTTLFYGYGFGLFARLERYQLMMVVVSVWIALLVASPLWLLRFKFGPLEWLWRSLTYLQPQPMRAREPVGPSWA